MSSFLRLFRGNKARAAEAVQALANYNVPTDTREAMRRAVARGGRCQRESPAPVCERPNVPDVHCSVSGPRIPRTGAAGQAGAADATGTSARFNTPAAIAVADSASEASRVPRGIAARQTSALLPTSRVFQASPGRTASSIPSVLVAKFAITVP